ncbi:hypothetical protein F7C95_14425 [Opitutia bacterium ISCC 51]|nr:hypothetical protein F7C95_14425 [Opitutae bacterium ISCC 51]QXD27193.1 hypothetical protein GA003_14340 [Opitutae bacterium ISCC 52]
MDTTQDNKLIYVLLAISSALGLILIFIGFAEPVADPGGTNHPSIASMKIGGDGAARIAFIGHYGFAFISLVFLMIVSLAAFGVSPKKRTREFWIYAGAAFAFTMLVSWKLFMSHQAFLESGETTYSFGFPTPTAWQLYGTWLCAIPLVAIYTFGFRKFIYTPEDEESFNQLLKSKSESD